MQKSTPDSTPGKTVFNIDVTVERMREVVEPFPRAALFELRDEGYISVFEQLVACIISVHTYDETMLPAASQLF